MSSLKSSQALFGFILISLAIRDISSSEISTLVTVKQGILNGTVETLKSGETYISFKGIPYAQPPVGNLRFKKPEAPSSWEGIRDASTHGYACYQYPAPLVGATNISEDCLYLNVYTRNTNNTKKAPVMLWIHGGSLMYGSGDTTVFGPDYLITKDVVLVTINYRLNAFGFLNLNTAEVPGNAGLKDQVAAMEWVKENIEQFGGNPDDITIFGESSGGDSVALHLVSPLSKGLFSKAIVQSGSCIADSSVTTNGKENAIQTLTYLGFDVNNETDLLILFQNATAADLISVYAKFVEENPLNTYIFNPAIEEEFEGVSSFLTKYPIDYLKCGEAADVPVIIGVTSGEGIIFFSDDMTNIDWLNNKTDLGVFRELKTNRSESEISKLSKQIKTFYMGGVTINNDTRVKFLNLESDYSFIYPAYRLASLLVEHNSSPVYFYYFTSVDDERVVDKALKGSYADILPYAAHGADLSALFYGALSMTNNTSREAETITNMVTLWTNFSINGSPTLNESLGVTWTQLDRDSRNYLQIDVPLSTAEDLLSDRITMWECLFSSDGLAY